MDVLHPHALGIPRMTVDPWIVPNVLINSTPKMVLNFDPACAFEQCKV